MPDLNQTVGLDISAFKSGATQLAAQVKNIETSFRASAAQMDNWSSTSNGLKERVTSLQEKLGLQRQELEKLTSAYKQAVQEQGADSKSAQSLASQMFNVQKQIESTQKGITRYSAELKNAEKQEKENGSSLSRLKSSFSGLADQSKKSTSNIKDHFSSLKSTVLGAVGGIVAGMSLKAIIEDTDAADKNLAQMDATLKSTGGAAGETRGQLVELAEAQSKVSTYSAETTEKAENMLLTFTNIKSNVFPQTLKATEDLATAMHIDATDAAKTLGKALQDPATGYTKLQRIGIVFSKSQQDTIKAMEKTGNVAGAQQLILDAVATRVGGSAKAAGSTLTGQIQIMQNNIKSAGVQIAGSLIPIASSLMPMVVSGVQGIAGAFTAHKAEIVGAAQAVANGIKTVGKVIGDIVSAARPYIAPIMADIGKIASNLFPSVTKSAKDMGSQLGGAVKTALGDVKSVLDWMAQHGEVVKAALVGIAAGFAAIKTASAITSILKKAKDGIDGLSGAAKGAKIFENLFGMSPQVLAVVGIIAAVAALAFVIIKNWGPISQFFANLWNGIKTGAGEVGNNIKSAFNGAINGIKGAWSGVTGFFSNLFSQIWSGITNGAKAAGNGIKSAATTVWGGISSAIMAVVSPLIKGVVGLWNSMKGGIQTAMNGLKTILGGVWNAIKNIVLGPVLLILDLVTGNFSKLRSDAIAIFNNLKNALSQIWSGIQQVFTGSLQAETAFMNSFFAGVKAVWGAISQFFVQTWANITTTATTAWNGFMSMLSAIGNGIRDTAINTWNGIVDFFAQLPGRIGSIMESVSNWVRGVWDGLVGFVQSVPGRIASGLSSLGSAVRGAFSDAINFIKGLPGEAWNWGRDIINGIVNGIKSAASAVGNAVSGVAQNIRNFLHFSKPDTGPLADFDTYMPDMMATMANGITNNIGKLKSAASRAAGAISSGLSISANMIPAYAGGYAAAPVVTSPVTEHNYYGPRQEVNVFQVGDEVVTGAVKNRLSRGIQNERTSVRGAFGYGT